MDNIEVEILKATIESTLRRMAARVKDYETEIANLSVEILTLAHKVSNLEASIKDDTTK